MKLLKCFLSYRFVSDFLVISYVAVLHLANLDMTKENLTEISIVVHINSVNMSMFPLMTFVSISQI